MHKCFFFLNKFGSKINIWEITFYVNLVPEEFVLFSCFESWVFNSYLSCDSPQWCWLHLMTVLYRIIEIILPMDQDESLLSSPYISNIYSSLHPVSEGQNNALSQLTHDGSVLTNYKSHIMCNETVRTVVKRDPHKSILISTLLIYVA